MEQLSVGEKKKKKESCNYFFNKQFLLNKCRGKRQSSSDRQCLTMAIFGNHFTELFFRTVKNSGKRAMWLRTEIIEYIYIFNMLDKEFLSIE